MYAAQAQTARGLVERLVVRRIWAVDGAARATQWSVPIKGIPFGPAVVDGYLVVGTDIGVLYAIAGR